MVNCSHVIIGQIKTFEELKSLYPEVFSYFEKWGRTYPENLPPSIAMEGVINEYFTRVKNYKLPSNKGLMAVFLIDRIMIIEFSFPIETNLPSHVCEDGADPSKGMYNCPYAPGLSCNQYPMTCSQARFEPHCTMAALGQLNRQMRANHDLLRKEGIEDAVCWMLNKIAKMFYDVGPKGFNRFIDGWMNKSASTIVDEIIEDKENEKKKNMEPKAGE